MNLRASYKTMIKDFVMSAAIYYAVMLAVTLAGILMLLIFGSENGSMGMNFDFSGYVFIFVLGLNSFKENFKFLNQNGVSRRTFYISRVAVMVSAALIMVLVDRFFYTALSLIKIKNFSVVFISELYIEVFEDGIQISGNQGPIVNVFRAMLASLCAYMALYGLGCFINLVFYRLGNLGKALVGAGVPVFFIIVLPVVDNILLNGVLGRAFMELINFTFSSLGNISLVFFVIALSGMVFTYFLMRRAPIKN